MAEAEKKNIFAVHANFSKHQFKAGNDLVMVKERQIEPNGQIKTHLRFFENYQRDFYVTKKRYRNHQSKKEHESLKKLDRFKTTQSNLERNIAKALNCRINKYRTMARNQFLYGSDIHVTNIILNKYREVYGEPTIMPTVGVMDYEWCVDTKTPTIGTYAHEEEVFLVVRKDLISKCGMNINQFKHAMQVGYEQHVLPILKEFYERTDKDGKKVHKAIKPVYFKLNIDVVDLDLNVIRKTFNHTHMTQPDYLTFWNGEADMDVIMDIAKSYRVELHEFMNDPLVPQEYRHTHFNRGASETIDANGNPKRKIPSERWHTLDNMASWQWIDIMCCYHTNRAHKPNLPSYAMDFILPKELGLGKLKLVDELNYLLDSDMEMWHRKMSNEHIVEYSLYALFDVIGPLLLEWKNFEISSQAYSEININPIGDFKKNPRKLCNSNHFNFLKEGEVIGSTSDKMTEEFDNMIYSANGWIITLNSSYHDTLESKAMKDVSSTSLFIPSCDDGDLTSSYPSNQRLLNTSKATTLTELTYTTNIPEEVMREIGLDLSSCGDNSIDFCCRVLGFPHLNEILEMYNSVHGAK